MNTSGSGTLKRLGVLWAIATLSISMLPQLLSMPALLVVIALLPIAWRLLAEYRHWHPMHMVLRALATAIAVTALILTLGGLLGRSAAVSLLVLMLSLKLLETFSVRDARIIASLSLFLGATQFLFSQGILMVFYIIACLLSALIALMYLQRREAFENLREAPDTDRSLVGELGFGLRLMGMAVPVGLALFMLFPRWASPLWGMPEDALDARSGLSDSMSPGSIQALYMDDSPAFRASFETGLPDRSELYWRGPVFWDFDGTTWRAGNHRRHSSATGKPQLQQALFRYELQMEPTEQRWLFSLDYPALVPVGTRLSFDYQLVSNRPITQLRNYVMASDPRFTDSPTLNPALRKAALKLPAGFNPRTAAMMAAWRSETKTAAAMVQRVLTYFNQQNFHYTLNPPLLSRNTVDEFLFKTRQGFCEHYASAFTVMMRMAGIPARVVTGYQGGWYSNFGSYVLVRQSDAHAWSEVWVKGSGWTRIDPTAAVAPERVERGSVGSLAQRRYLLDFAWFRNARNTFDLAQRAWNTWVVAFDAAKQSRLFSGLGWGFFDAARLVIAMITAILITIASGYLLLPLMRKLRNSRQQDPLLRLWQKFRIKLDKAGVKTRRSMGPRELACLAGGQLKYAEDGINRITELYIRCRYSQAGCSESELAKLIKDFHLRQAP